MKRLLAFVLGLGFYTTVFAQTLFDSGSPSTTTTSLALGGGYYCALNQLPVEFCQNSQAVGLAFDSPTTITGVTPYLDSVNQGVTYSPTEGVVEIILYDEHWQQLDRAEIFVLPQQVGWQDASGLNWGVPAGKYWFAVEVPESSKFVGGWTLGAEYQAEYAATRRGHQTNWVDVDPTSLGLVVSGFTQPSSDLNRDGFVTVDDLDALNRGLREHSTDLYFDVTGDQILDFSDWQQVMLDAGLQPGDVDLDGTFDSSDIIQLFQSGKYDDGIDFNSDWRDGDFTGDLDFDSSDLIMALSNGYAVQGANAVAFVPEPSSFVLFLLGLVLTRTDRKGQHETVIGNGFGVEFGNGGTSCRPNVDDGTEQ